MTTFTAPVNDESSNNVKDMGLDSDEDMPRRLVQLPSTSTTGTTQILALGGDEGTISVLERDSFRPVRRYDEDAVRALAVSPNGRRIIVGFDDGSTRVYCYDDYVAPAPHPFCASAAKSGVSSNGLLSQSDTLVVPEDEISMAGPNSDAPVRDLKFHPTMEYYVAIATESGFCISNVHTQDTIFQERYLERDCEKAHDQSGIRSLSFHPSGTTLASLAMDGRVCLWTVAAGVPSQWKLLHRDAHKSIVKTDAGELLCADPSDRSCAVVWGGDNALVVSGNISPQVRRVDNDKVGESQLVVPDPEQLDQAHKDTIVTLEVSPDQRYFVSSGRDGRVVLWEFQAPSDDEEDQSPLAICVRQLSHCKSIPTHMLWYRNDQEESLFLACANGKLVTLPGPIVPKKKKKTTTLQATQESSKSASRLTKKRSGGGPPKDVLDSDDDDSVGFEDTPRTSTTNTTTFVDDEADEDVEPTNDHSKDTIDGPSGTFKDDDDSPMLEEDTYSDVEDSNEYPQDTLVQPYRSVTKTVPPQAAFAPSSTPLELSRRFLCWNHIGALTLFRGDHALNSVNIDFTDSATHRPITFTDNLNFILGSLGEDGGIFATDLVEDEDNNNDLGDLVEDLNMSERTKAAVKRSQQKRMKKDGGARKPTGSSIYFHRYETFGPIRDKDWYLTLPDGERVLGCACGEGWAAAMTSRRFLRFFSSGGNQGQIVWLPGEPVTMAGRGCFLAVFYHETTPLSDGTQKLGYMLYDAVACRLLTKGSVSCISRGSSLTWAGFSNKCALLAMDSDGMISMLTAKPLDEACPSGTSPIWEWVPMLDTVGVRKSSDDDFWPITALDGKLVCVPLKGGTQHPDATRRPVTSSLAFRMPMARATLPKSSVLEELSVRSNIALAQMKVTQETVNPEGDEEFETEYRTLCAQVDKVTLKLFAATVEAGKLERALDLVERLHLEKSFDLAIVMADKHDRLADLIEEAKERKFSTEVEDACDDSGTYSRQGSYQSTGQISPDSAHGLTSKRAFHEMEGVSGDVTRAKRRTSAPRS